MYETSASVESRAALETLANRLTELVSQPYEVDGHRILSSVSIGIAVGPHDGNNADDLLKAADLALYAAKKTGGGSASFFSEELRRELDHRKRMEADLKAAVAAESFEAFFQPQVSLSSSQITGVEALVRWQHPERGMVPPSDCLPVAEKSGLMSEVGRIVMRKAIAAAPR